MIRARRRESERRSRRASRVGLGAATVLGAAAFAAPSAQAANLEVNQLSDAGDGTCDSTCTLRDAMLTADLTPATDDTITFKAGLSGTIRLISGQLGIASPMTIQGPGADLITISGDKNANGIADASDSRVLYTYTALTGNGSATVAGVTMSGGFSGGGLGGGVYAYDSKLTLDHVVITGNRTNSSGGGIESKSSVLTVVDSTISGNSVSGGGTGGGINTNTITSNPGLPNSLVLRNSTVSSNTADSAGGVFTDTKMHSLLIDSSTISGNVGRVDGGLFVGGPDTGPAVIQNSTISGNFATYAGSGIEIYDIFNKGAIIENSTISDNTTGAASGGGLYRKPRSNGVTLSSTIVAGNKAGGVPKDLAEKTPVQGVFNAGFSVIQAPAGGTIQQSPVGSDLIGVDPQLSPLANNGGPTQTQLIAPTSPAVDAGIANGLSTDQRGLPRTSQQPGGNAAGSDGTDIGAVELPDGTLESPDATAKKKQKVKGKKVAVKVVAGAGEAVTVDASGSIKTAAKGKHGRLAKGGSVALSAPEATVAGGKTTSLTLKPTSKSGARKVAKLLVTKGKAKASISVVLTDPAGNTVTKQLAVTLKGSKRK